MTRGRMGVIFDCDGTLLDSLGVWSKMEHYLADQAQATLAQEDIDKLVTLTNPESAVLFHENYGLGETALEVEKMMDDFLLSYYRNEAVCRPGAFDFVKGLYDAGVVMTMASSSPLSYLEAGLEHTGLNAFIQEAISVDDVGHSKREPQIYLYAQKCMGSDSKFTWGFEDSVYALHTLRSAGFRTVGIYAGEEYGTHEELAAAADLVIDSFEELNAPDFIEMTFSDAS